MKNPLLRAINILEGQSALARACGPAVSQQNIWYWLHKMRGVVPAEACPLIERATNGRVTCRNLRPDVFMMKPPLRHVNGHRRGRFVKSR